MRFRLTLKEPHAGQDNYFLWAMVLLPVLAEAAYMVDAYRLLTHPVRAGYAGLFSTIVIIFAYLRYAVPIEGHKTLTVYYVALCIFNEAGTVAYLVFYIKTRDICNIIVCFGWGILEITMTGCLIYYRVIKQSQPKFHLECKHLFQFIARLEIILAIFIPFFYTNRSIVLTRHSIAFFLLFEFFSEDYHRFRGKWIKPILYLFVGAVTVCVATEWIYSIEHNRIQEIISIIFEFISACLCDSIIIFQFTDYHFKPSEHDNVAHVELKFHEDQHHAKSVHKGSKTVEIEIPPGFEKAIGTNTVIDAEF